MTTPNPLQGEIALTLGGAEVVLRPTFSALMQLEEKLGCGLVVLARRFAEGTFTLADVLAVVEAGAGRDAPPKLGEAVVAAGLANLAGPIAEFLAAALSGQPVPGKP